jgi:hypothetical protein
VESIVQPDAKDAVGEMGARADLSTGRTGDAGASEGDGSSELLVLVALVGLAVLIGMLLPIGGKPKGEN